MTDGAPPPPDPLPVPAPRPVPAESGRPAAAHRPPATPTRARMPGAVGCFAICGGILTLLAVGCVGGSALLTASVVRDQTRIEEARISRIEAERALATQATVLLRDLAITIESIRRTEYSYPLELPDLPPDDPWGSKVLYRQISPDRAELRSVGPDRRQGTSDDVVLELPFEN